MNIISIDVGIKNLAFCLLEKTHEKKSILKWDVLNLCEEKFFCNECCDKEASYIIGTKFLCKKHSKNNKKLPKELSERNLKKIKVKDLKDLLKKENIYFDEKHSKIRILEYLIPFCKNNYLCNIPKTNANNVDLVSIGIEMKKQLDEILKDIKIDYVIIENQISPIANRMKTIQGMIAQYFIMKDVTNIFFISAQNKLKEYTDKQMDYKDRKKLGIEITREFLINNECDEMYNIFEKHKKKDDMADSLLQGLWFIKNKLK
jgi:hypothetical protein